MSAKIPTGALVMFSMDASFNSLLSDVSQSPGAHGERLAQRGADMKLGCVGSGARRGVRRRMFGAVMGGPVRPRQRLRTGTNERSVLGQTLGGPIAFESRRLHSWKKAGWLGFLRCACRRLRLGGHRFED
ncbi:hypothetical protein CGC21_17705 [Leishmania donovani]|uniref:Uncharacterized protein n=1 Tax=Leishmania donovani TaxID=5661 RepID=A0A504Y338_LEIDO|nr:hypothetical protein CGC21_17705 [Leishmania donovani]